MTDSNSGPASENRPYLGDPQIVGKLLQGIARETIQCRIASKQGILSEEDARAIEEKEAAGAARALLGRDKKYDVDSNWNVPGVIDGFIKTELNLQEKGAEPILTAGLMKFVGEVHKRLDLLNNPSQNPKAENEIQDIIEQYRNVFLGLSFAATPITAPVPDVAPVVAAPKPLAPPIPVPVIQPQVTPGPVAPIVPQPQPAPAKPQPVPVPIAASIQAAPEKERSGGGLKWAALLILLLLVGGIVFFVMNKPKPAVPPVEVVKTEPTPKAPVAPKVTDAAPVLNANGTVDLVDESGKAVKTITMKNGKKIVHIYDSVRVGGKSLFLVATDDSDDTYDVWLIDESGDGRTVAGKAQDAKISPDGTLIAYTTLEHILVVEEAGGKRITTAEGAHDFTWAPDNKSIVFLRAGEGHSLTHPSALVLARLQLADLKIITLTGGFYDDVRPMIQPDGTIFLVAGGATGLPSFWKVEAAGSEPQQITNVRLEESTASWVPTPFSTAQWSTDGRWLIYDYKEGSTEQIWGLEFDKDGNLKRSLKIAEGLLPRWITGGKFVCLKNVQGSLQASVHTIPES